MVTRSIVTTLKSLQTRLFRKIFPDNLPLSSWPYDASDNGINDHKLFRNLSSKTSGNNLLKFVSIKISSIKKTCIFSDYSDDSKRVSSQEIFLC